MKTNDTTRLFNDESEPWWVSDDNLITLARDMDCKGLFDAPEDVITFFEYPYRYERNWDNLHLEEEDGDEEEDPD